jgi:hypothetical protein
MSRDKLQAQTPRKHPEPYQHDLNPNAMAGQNMGLGETEPSRRGPTAYEVKPVRRRFRAFTDDELKQLHLLPPESRLEQGATYLDLANLDVGEFTATGERRAGPNNWIVAKKTVPYPLWNRLLGVDTPERVE